MRTWPTLICVALALVALAGPRQAQPTLASELSRAQEAWLLADDAQAEARVAALALDTRVQGELARWYAGFNAALKLKRGDSAGAALALKPTLDNARDARAYFRAARLLLAFDQGAKALEFTREGRKRHPESRALARLEAELLWLGGESDASIEACCALIASVPSANYPYEPAPVLYWEQVEAWPESGLKLPAKDAAGKEEESGWRRPMPMGKDEPHASLCASPVWYATDLPGLERCLAECARDEKRAAKAVAKLDALLAEVASAIEALDRGRGGVEERAQLEKALRLARARALCELRIAVLHELGKGNAALAEKLARRGLAASRTDVGLLDVLLQALAMQGKAEEARQFPLMDLNRNAGLVIYDNPVLAKSAQYDRAFEAARVLSHTNKEAGKAQFEAVRNALGAGDESTVIGHGNVGLWLLLKGEAELARWYLEEASRLSKPDDAMGFSVPFELPLLAMQVEELNAAPAPAEGAPNPRLEIARRAGLLRGFALELNSFLAGLGNPGIYLNYRAGVLPDAARASAKGEAFVPMLLGELPAWIAKGTTADELDAVLGENSEASKALRTTLEQFATLVDECNANRQNWEAREKAGTRALPVACALETRALLIQARFAQNPAKSLVELNTWLAKYQPMLDPRRTFKSLPTSEQESKLAEMRAKRGIPEVFHSGLLLDSALALARQGKFEDAGELLLLNERPWLDGVDQARRMHLAALFFRKAGKPEQELMARLAVGPAQGAGGQAVLQEFARVRAEILEFGTADDVREFVSFAVVPVLRGEAIERFMASVPELKDTDKVMWFRRTPQDGAKVLYQATLENNAFSVIVENWPKILMAGNVLKTPWRMAIWCLVSDMAAQRRWDSFGLASAHDCAVSWRMLARIGALAGAEHKAAAEKLSRLEQRCTAGMEDDLAEDGYSAFDE